MWNKAEYQDDVYVHLYFIISDKVLRSGDECPSSSGVTNEVMYLTPTKKVTSDSEMVFSTPKKNVTHEDDFVFSTPKNKAVSNSKLVSPATRKSPRLVCKSIDAQINTAFERLLLNDEDMCHPDDNVDVEYENIQLDNVEEDLCHPVDDDRSLPCFDDVDNDIDIADVRDIVALQVT
ncbi:uncharacterized protein LOC113330645 [Papaver somniferum]|uniref:uncharacterized protein LOC113330645 n=1 Tax=Papaver somniferum TaxID=3469 RepID=UPI000E7041E3|nr:uncharacterized protein LOC113330645 [Papaver somniferum]